MEMEYTEYVTCPLCRDPMCVTIPHVTEHLERKHLLQTSAAVLAGNMFANSQANEEVWIILKEFDEKNKAIEFMEKNKIAALHVLHEKDLEIKARNEKVNELKKKLTGTPKEPFQSIEQQQKEIHELKAKNTSFAYEMDTRRQEYELKVLENKLKCEKENGKIRRNCETLQSQLESTKTLLVEVEARTSRMKKCVENERITHHKETENQRKQILELKNRNASLSSEMENLKFQLIAVENKLKRGKESKAENAQLKDLIKTLKEQLVTEKSNLKENIDGLKKENELIQNNCVKFEEFIEKKCVEAKALGRNLEEIKKNCEGLDKENEKIKNNCINLQRLCVECKVVEEIKSCKLAAVLNKESMKLKIATENEEKVYLEDSLAKRESEIVTLSNKFRHALDQANLLNIDLKKHQQNLGEHFQTILKARQIIKNTSNLAPGVDGSVMKMYEEVVDSAVKILVVDSVGQQVLKLSSEIESLHNYLSDKTTSGEDVFAASESREDNNNNVG
eukprot:GFUD01037352.1.p1 GENE.GFUD01037352.1~~GFUD01037352.1.p1  ORF type:complete len:522 (+),score=147.37 GFUD01037352.1:50-1567(+)